MADPEVRLRWSPEDGTLELVGVAPGPAGLAVLDHGAVRFACDIAAGGALARLVVDREEPDDLDQQVMLDLLADGRVPIGGGPKRLEMPIVLDDEVASGLSRVSALAVVDDIVRGDALAPVVGLAATCEAAALGLEAAGVLGTAWQVAVDRLWAVVGDPEVHEVLAGTSRAARAVVVELLGRCLRTDSPYLDQALRELHDRWIDTIGPQRSPRGRDDRDLYAAPMMAPSMAAAPAAGAGRSRRARREALDAAAMPAGPAGPAFTRVGDEIRVRIPASASPSAWVRVATHADRVLLAVAPVEAGREGEVRLPVDGAHPLESLLVDVVAHPAAPVRDGRGEAMAEAIAAGRAATAAERQGRLGAATTAWRTCHAAWTRAGDKPRAAQAAARAAAPQLGYPLVHERIAV